MRIRCGLVDGVLDEQRRENLSYYCCVAHYRTTGLCSAVRIAGWWDFVDESGDRRGACRHGCSSGPDSSTAVRRNGNLKASGYSVRSIQMDRTELR